MTDDRDAALREAVPQPSEAATRLALTATPDTFPKDSYGLSMWLDLALTSTDQVRRDTVEEAADLWREAEEAWENYSRHTGLKPDDAVMWKAGYCKARNIAPAPAQDERVRVLREALVALEAEASAFARAIPPYENSVPLAHARAVIKATAA